MSGPKKTAGNTEMTANQQAYSRGVEAIEINNSHITPRNKVDEINGKGQTETMVRTDVDPNSKFRVPEVQNQDGKISLNVTSYNVYQGGLDIDKKPTKVVVGVAGSDSTSDWIQNVSPLENRSSDYMVVGEEVIEHPYKIEINRMVGGFKSYYDENIPIVITGDSKGGEDSAFLALMVEKSGIPVDHLYITNPKGIRVNNQDFQILEKMANEGKITKEIVYPEALSDYYIDGSLVADGRVIPFSNVIYTVPNSAEDIKENHTIGNYAEDVYQGLNNRYKFQCSEEPKFKLLKTEIYSTILYQQCEYTYTVTSVTDNAGRNISVADYYFEEKTEHLQQLRLRIDSSIKVLQALETEDVEALFTSAAIKGQNALKTAHKQHILSAVGSSDIDGYKRYREVALLLVDKTMSIVTLHAMYNSELDRYVNAESIKYTNIVLENVRSEINAYKEYVRSELFRLNDELSKINAAIENISQSKESYKKSQEEIKLIIKKQRTNTLVVQPIG